MLWDLINREKLRRALLYLLYVLLCLLAQDSIFASLQLFGVNMFFLPAAAVAIGMFEDGVWGAAFGLFRGGALPLVCEQAPFRLHAPEHGGGRRMRPLPGGRAAPQGA